MPDSYFGFSWGPQGSAVLGAWLSQPGKNPKEQALKKRLAELMRD